MALEDQDEKGIAEERAGWKRAARSFLSGRKLCRCFRGRHDYLQEWHSTRRVKSPKRDIVVAVGAPAEQVEGSLASRETVGTPAEQESCAEQVEGSPAPRETVGTPAEQVEGSPASRETVGTPAEQESCAEPCGNACRTRIMLGALVTPETTEWRCLGAYVFVQASLKFNAPSKTQAGGDICLVEVFKALAKKLKVSWGKRKQTVAQLADRVFLNAAVAAQLHIE